MKNKIFKLLSGLLLAMTLALTLLPAPAHATSYTNSSITSLSRDSQNRLTSVTVRFTTSDTPNSTWYLSIKNGSTTRFTGPTQKSGDGTHTMTLTPTSPLSISSGDELILWIYWQNNYVSDQTWNLSSLMQTFDSTYYSVSLSLGAGMKWDSSSGGLSQTVVKGQPISSITIDALSGGYSTYYDFLPGYSWSSGGLSVTRISDSRIRVSGTPNCSAAPTLPSARAKTSLTGITLAADPDPLRIGDTLNVTAAPGEATATIAWYRYGSSGSRTLISDASGSSYTTTQADLGYRIQAEATGNGDFGNMANVITTEPVTDEITGVSLSGSTPVEGIAVSAGLTPSAATAGYQWYRNASASTEGGTPIEGATGSSYTPAAADIGSHLYAVATGTGNYFGTVSTVSTAPVSAALTVNIASSPALTITAGESTSLTAVPSGGPPSPIRSYSWINVGDPSNILSTADTLTVSSSHPFPASTTTQYQVMITDVGYGSASASASVTINPLTYTVHYNGNGSTGGSTADSVHIYDIAKALNANGFTRAYKVTYAYNGATGGHSVPSASAGYSFKNWTAEASGGDSYADSQSVTNLASSGTVQLYAQWNNSSVTLPTPTRTGYTFGGWYSDAECGDADRIGGGGASYTPTEPTTIYAKWTLDKHSISYADGQHGCISGTAAADYETTYTDKLIPDTGYSLPTAITMTMGGATFTAFGYSNSTGDISIAKNKLTGDIVVSGACTPNGYTVEYYGNGATGGATAGSYHIYDAAKALTANGFTRAYKVTYTYNDATDGASPAGETATYTFKSWTTAAAGGADSYTDAQSVTNLAASGVFQLYAQWNSAAVTLPAPTRTGYAFGGWYSDAALTSRVGGGGDSYIPTANINLYAKWTLMYYTVSYSGGQHGSITGTTAANYETAYSDKLVPAVGYSRPAAITTTMGGAPFTDFSYSATIGDFSIAKNKIHGNLVITGACTPNSYTVRYNGAGATGGATADSVHVYDAAKALNPNGFTRIYNVAYDHNYVGSSNTGAAAAYVFTGWGTTGDNTGTRYANGQSVTNLATSGIFDLYAKWTPTSVTLPTPARADYSFGGWYRDPACTEASRAGNGGTSYTPTTDITLYAKWTLIPFTVEKHESTDETPAPQAAAAPAAPQVYDYGAGKITVVVPPDEDVVLAELPDKQTVIESALSPDEFETVANGSTIDIKLDVKRVKDEQPSEEKQAIESAVEDFSQEVEGLTMGLHLDISLAKRIDDGDWKTIPDAGKPLAVVIQLPEEMIIPGAEYYIIRNHEGGCTLLRDQDHDPATITILTQFFSAYAIAYKPANTLSVWLWILIALAALLSLTFYLVKKRPWERKQRFSKG